MRAGNLRHRIIIQKQKVTKNAYGEDIVTWVDDATCQARIRALRGREYFNAQQAQADVTHDILMRYRTLSDGTRVNPKCRIKHDSRYFLVRSAIANERESALNLLCVEEV